MRILEWTKRNRVAPRVFNILVGCVAIFLFYDTTAAWILGLPTPVSAFVMGSVYIFFMTTLIVNSLRKGQW